MSAKNADNPLRRLRWLVQALARWQSTNRYPLSHFMLESAACNKHDQCYGTYGKSKWECDKRFWQEAFAESGPWPNVIVPTIYFAFPFIFGGNAYSAAQSWASGR
jgi:hypothetical protein